MVEQETLNFKVQGSSPWQPTFPFLLPQYTTLKFVAYCGQIPRNMLQTRGGTISFTGGIRVERKEAYRASGLVKGAHT